MGWSDDLSEWLKPFLARLGYKARRRMCPLYVAGLIGPGERKSVGPMAERLALAVLALHDLGVVEFRVSGLANAPALAAFGQAVIPLVRRTVSHHASHARQPDAGNARLSALRTGI